MYSIKSVFRNIFLIILFVLVVFAPPLRLLPHYTWILSLLGILTLKDKKFREIIGFDGKSNHEFLIFLAFFISINSVLVPFVHGFPDFSYIPLQIGIILCLFRAILLLYCLHRFGKENILTLYSKYFFVACFIYISFTLFFIVDPEFKSFWLDNMLTNVEDRGIEFAAYEFRYSLNGFAAFDSSSIFSFACLLCSYIIATSRKVSILKIACLMMLLVGCFFYGRISLIGMVLGVYLIVWSSGSVTKTLKIFAIIVAFVIGLLSVLNVVSKSNEALVIWQEWAFAIIKQLFVDKEVTDYSVTHMVEDMYYMPNIITFLFGDGKYSNADGTYYGHTDVGFMRLLLYGGFICLILAYSLIIKLSLKTIFISKSAIFRRFIILSTILFLLLEMKGESYQRAIMMIYPLFLIQNYLNKKIILSHV